MQPKLFIYLLISCIFTAKAQTLALDKFRKAYYSSKDNNERQKNILEICRRNYSLPPDSFKKFISLGRKTIPQDFRFATELDCHELSYLIIKGEYEEVTRKSDSFLNLYSEYPEIIANIKIIKTRALIRNNKSSEAIELALSFLREAELRKDSLNILQAYVFLGWAHMELEKYQEAVKWLEKGVSFTRNPNHFIRHPSVFINLASSYNNLSNSLEAQENISQALNYARQAENLTILANALNIRADIYLKAGNKELARADLEEALKVREQIGDPYYILSDMAQLSYFYASNMLSKEGIIIAERGIELSKKTRQLPKQIYLYSALAENYRIENNHEKLAITLSTILSLKDSLYAENSEKAIAELDARYETEKNRNTILTQEFELKQGRFTTIALICLLILILMLFGSLYMNYSHVQRRKMATMLDEQKKIALKAVLDAEENERKRIAADLHDNLGAHAAAISASVSYFKKGLYDQNETLEQLDENALGIVNHLNDTIWVLKNEKLALTNLADRFKLWFKRLLVNYPDINYHFKEDILTDHEFTPNRMLHLFMIMKEAITNSLKHSSCKNINVSFVSGNLNWEILISDDGKGFMDGEKISGNGIANMKKRAFEADCNLEWIINKYIGTGVKISGLIQTEYGRS